MTKISDRSDPRERLVPNKLDGPLDAAYSKSLQDVSVRHRRRRSMADFRG